VLIVDILRPLPWHLQLANRLYSKVSLRFAIASKMITNLEKFR